MTTQSGVRPDERHLMFMNFSAPMSAPKPASVTTSPWGPTSLSAIMSATTDELPCAMLANGPAASQMLLLLSQSDGPPLKYARTAGRRWSVRQWIRSHHPNDMHAEWSGPEDAARDSSSPGLHGKQMPTLKGNRA